MNTLNLVSKPTAPTKLVLDAGQSLVTIDGRGVTIDAEEFGELRLNYQDALMLIDALTRRGVRTCLGRHLLRAQYEAGQAELDAQQQAA